MMERTYGRRKPGMLKTLSDSLNDPEYIFSSSSSPENDPRDFSALPFSSQDSSSLWNSSSRTTFSQNGGVRRFKRHRKGGDFTLTSTLMEAQEFGELMEHVDEANFALDGLQKGHQIRIKRAALSSLLSISASQHQRRSLRAKGISQSIIDVILGLNLDDIPSNLAAATIFFVLTADGQDERFMESTNSIKFLIKLLKPVVSTSTKGKPRNIGSKLLSILKNVEVAELHDPSSSDIILLKAQEILDNCKEMRLTDSFKTERMRPELSTKLVALLAMEKACLSKISFDDISAKKSGGMFKEKLRELGGLDAVFEVVMDCQAVLERWVACAAISVNIKDDLNKHTLMLLLKCLKIMENATFLSPENQDHLLRFSRSLVSHGSRLSFTELMINIIKMLSGLQLRARRNIQNPQPHCANGVHESALNRGISVKDPFTLKTRVCSKNGSFAGRLTSLGSGISTRNPKSCHVKEPSSRKREAFASLEDSQDPFAFNLEDFGPSKCATTSGKQKKSRAQKRKGNYREISDQLVSSQEELNHRLHSQEESSDGNCHITAQSSSIEDIDKESLCLLSDCLLTAVKVLVNLTNDNSIGCRQVAAFGGLERMAELISGHFPSLTRSPLFSELKMPGTGHEKDKHLTDQELDFLVAILGLLVNLVEKDGTNRARLAAASVQIMNPNGLQASEQDMIPLLCSIFLTNQGSTDTKEEAIITLDNEEAVLESEKEAEKMIVEAYSALLLAFISTESRSIRNAIKDYLPKRNLAILVPVLDRFVAFHMTLNMIPPETHKAVMEVIESCKLP